MTGSYWASMAVSSTTQHVRVFYSRRKSMLPSPWCACTHVVTQSSRPTCSTPHCAAATAAGLLWPASTCCYTLCGMISEMQDRLLCHCKPAAVTSCLPIQPMLVLRPPQGGLAEHAACPAWASTLEATACRQVCGQVPSPLNAHPAVGNLSWQLLCFKHSCELKAKVR